MTTGGALPGSRAAGPQDPRTWLDPALLAGLANLELVARSVVEGLLTGLHRSVQHGFSLEFADYRPYTPGDDPRFIDWNAYARTGRTYLKRYRGETTTHLMLLLDVSASMGHPAPGVGKLRYAKFLCASLAWLAARQHDAVGLQLFDEELRDQLPPRSRPGHLRKLLHCLESAEPRAGTDIPAALDALHRRTHRRGLVAVVSDFYCEPEALLAAVRPLAYRGHDIMLFQVLDPEELAPQWRAPSLLVDAETQQELLVSSDFARHAYPARAREHVAALARAAGSAGADHVLVDTSQPLDASLRAYLSFRQRRG